LGVGEGVGYAAGSSVSDGLFVFALGYLAAKAAAKCTAEAKRPSETVCAVTV